MQRFRIGLMVGNKSIDYVHSIRMGVQNTLEDAGHTLIAISDLIPFHSRSNAKSYLRVAFEIAARLNLDAVIVPAGIIAGYLMNDHGMLGELLQILGSDKTLIIEREIDGYRCVGKDNAPGMHACMRHLIEECGFTRIAFIGGPESSVGAREREDIFFQEMEAHGLDIPPSCLAHGEFSGECGDAIDRLIDENRDLEAIVCCCDLIAQSVYRVMRRRHLAVGSDIAVTGFDDQEFTAHMDPPLSTVHMTGYDLGCMAAREAIRICRGQGQEEYVLSSSFVVRGSCGEDTHGLLDRFRSLLSQDPAPIEEVVAVLLESTLSMAGRRVTEDFRAAMFTFVTNMRLAYLRHMEHPEHREMLFSTQDLTLLFHQPYQSRLSMEGFHAAMLALVQAMIEEAPQQNSDWAIGQISNLHLGIARMLNATVQENRNAMSRREWVAFHMTDDALRESNNPTKAYELILEEFRKLGVNQADLYLLSEPVPFIGSRTFALSDTVVPIGRMNQRGIRIAQGDRSISLQELLDRLLPRHGAATAYTVGGVMAGNELVGIAGVDAGTLDDDGQLIAFLNLGIALKHLQMIASERESNELLSKSNLALERQSYYDEMTGTLNRRGFMNRLGRILGSHQGKTGVLLYLDLDGLKTINDNFGHEAGDEAICQTTRVLKACLPADSLLGRMGGDEFVGFVLTDNRSAIDSVGHAIEGGMSTFNATHSYSFHLSISYGGVFLEIGDDTFANITQYMVQADERLYEMKKRRSTSRRFASGQ